MMSAALQLQKPHSSDCERGCMHISQTAFWGCTAITVGQCLPPCALPLFFLSIHHLLEAEKAFGKEIDAWSNRRIQKMD